MDDDGDSDINPAVGANELIEDAVVDENDMDEDKAQCCEGGGGGGVVGEFNPLGSLSC